MATQQDFTPDDWKRICAAPYLAGLAVTFADMSGPVGVAKEAAAVGRAILESASNGPTEIVKGIAEAYRSGTRPEMPAVPADRTQARAAFIDGAKAAVAAVAAKSPAEAESFKTWLVGTARAVAEASKEGGFLGIGGTRVSDAEQAALDELARALGTRLA
jgi:ABC-type glycerol-3-phosphate transport system substrate-binding protein